MADENAASEIVIPPNIGKRRTRPAVLWGTAALIAVSTAALLGQTEKGAQRLQIALAKASEPGRILAQIELPWLTVDKDTGGAETMRLAAAVRELSADRDRLKIRIASLERTLDDTTGSIKKQVEEVAAAQSAAKEKEEIAAASPMTAAPATVAAAMPSITPVPLSGPALAPWPHHPTQETPIPTPAPAAQIASLPTQRQMASEKTPVTKKEFGLDLGRANSVEALRAHWSAVKANYGPLLKGVQARYLVHEQRPAVLEYHLILGPFATAAVANALCGRLTAARVYCHTAMFEGDRLAAQP